MAEKKQIPVVDGLFTWPSEDPKLIGGMCKLCGRYFFSLKLHLSTVLDVQGTQKRLYSVKKVNW